ncbi:MAG: tetratricopeptide repeat protein, partial [Geminicoccaceae bacterium]
SFLHWQRAFFESTLDRDGEIARAADYAEQSVSLDPIDPQAHWVLGRAALLRGDLDLGVDELSTAVELNPSHARGHFSLGYGKLFQEPSADVIDDAAAARRISPYDPMSFAYLCLFAEANLLIGRHDEAITWARRAARPRNAHYHAHAVVAWCLEIAGDHEAALAEAAEVRRRRPDYTRAAFFRAYPYQEPQRALIDDALRRLGF